MPCENNYVDSITEYETVLSEISSLCLQHNTEHICIVRDMNADISMSHSRHTRLLLQFEENEQLGECGALWTQGRNGTMTVFL